MIGDREYFQLVMWKITETIALKIKSAKSFTAILCQCEKSHTNKKIVIILKYNLSVIVYSIPIYTG